jgi:hypothetical protein
MTETFGRLLGDLKTQHTSLVRDNKPVVNYLMLWYCFGMPSIKFVLRLDSQNGNTL